MNTKIRNILLFSIIVSFILTGEGILNLSFVNASPGWLTGWSYRKGHVINSATGAGTNYQVRIVVHKSSGTDNGEDVYVGTNVRDDFGDVRFTDDNGITPLDYWMETYTSGVEATFWVEIKDNLSSQDQTIYVYYGKSGATTTSNGTATFEFFDDFDDLNKWTIDYTQYTPLFEQTTIDGYSVGRVNVNQHDERISIKSNTMIPRAKAVEARIKHISWNIDAYQRFSFHRIDGNNLISYFDYASFFDLYYLIKIVGGTLTQVDTYSVGHPSGWYIYEIYDDGTNVDVNRDFTEDVLDGSIPELQDDGYIYIRNYEYNNGTSEFAIDYIRVRKYTSPEPTHGSWFTSFLPGSPSSLGPTNYVNGSWISDTTPTFEFTQSDPDSSDTLKYRIQIDNNSNFSSPVVDYTSDYLSQGATSFTVGQAPGSGSYTQSSQGQTLSSGFYYWRVMSEDQRGETDSWTRANSGNIAFKISIGKFYTGVKNTVFSSGAVTYSQEPNTNNLIDFSITPSRGSIEVTIFYWFTSGTHYKKWKEKGSDPDATTTHVVGDLAPNTSYPVKVNGVLFGNYTSNSSGQISFVYDLGYSDKIFEVGEPPDLIPTGNNISYLFYLLPITFLLIGSVLYFKSRKTGPNLVR